MELKTTTYKLTDISKLQEPNNESHHRLRHVASLSSGNSPVRDLGHSNYLSKHFSLKRSSHFAQSKKHKGLNAELKIKPNDNVYHNMLKADVKYSANKTRTAVITSSAGRSCGERGAGKSAEDGGLRTG